MTKIHPNPLHLLCWDEGGGRKARKLSANSCRQLAELGKPRLDIIGGKDCEGVTKTPQHGELFRLGDISVKSVHTPCHTQDSICFYMEDPSGRTVFTGDTLFISGV